VKKDRRCNGFGNGGKKRNGFLKDLSEKKDEKFKKKDENPKKKDVKKQIVLPIVTKNTPSAIPRVPSDHDENTKKTNKKVALLRLNEKN